MPGALAIYDRVDYIKVTPESALATFADATHARAISSSRRSDISAAPTENCTPPMMWSSVPWTSLGRCEVFYAAEGPATDYVGKVSPMGLLDTASPGPGNNFDVWVVATARKRRTRTANR